jgi:hypothetical protein
MRTKNFEIFRALKNQVNEGWVWILREAVEHTTGDPNNERPTVKISSKNGSQVVCEARIIYGTFVRDYDELPDANERTKNGDRKLKDAENPIIISAWYRWKLGIKKDDKKVDLEIFDTDCPIDKLLACYHHPQITVRVSYWLGIIGVALGILSIVLSFIPKK